MKPQDEVQAGAGEEGFPDHITRYEFGRDEEGFSTGTLVPSATGMWIASVSVYRLRREVRAELSKARAEVERLRAEMAEVTAAYSDAQDCLVRSDAQHIAELANAREQGWVDVMNELPAEGVDVLFDVPHFRGVEIGRLYEGRWVSESTSPSNDEISFSMSEVSFWQPVPAPPQPAKEPA